MHHCEISGRHHLPSAVTLIHTSHTRCLSLIQQQQPGTESEITAEKDFPLNYLNVLSNLKNHTMLFPLPPVPVGLGVLHPTKNTPSVAVSEQ